LTTEQKNDHFKPERMFKEDPIQNVEDIDSVEEPRLSIQDLQLRRTMTRNKLIRYRRLFK